MYQFLLTFSQDLYKVNNILCTRHRILLILISGHHFFRKKIKFKTEHLNLNQSLLRSVIPP